MYIFLNNLGMEVFTPYNLQEARTKKLSYSAEVTDI